jgi:Ca2+-transporting ATPase
MKDPPDFDPALTGLTSQEADKRLRVAGLNVVVPPASRIRFGELWRVLSDPMGLMLLALAGVYLSIGATRDGVAMLVAWVPITAVGVLLSVRADRALRALRGEVRSQVRVFRDGKLKMLHSIDLVPGDVIALEAGQTLPADGEVLRGHALQVNEAALTGESVPLEKAPGDPFFCGTETVSGSGFGLIRMTGNRTRFGKIAALVSDASESQTPLQRDLQRLVRRIFSVAILLAIILGAVEWLRHREWVTAIISSLTFAMSGVPEEFPIVFTLYLSLGAVRLARHGVLVKSLPSVEALGRVQVVCTDKTGTLTEGKFRLISILPWKAGSVTPALETWARLACEEHPVDLMDLAIHEGTRELEGGHRWISEVPFDPVTKVVSRVWSHVDGSHSRAMKGAVEGVIRHCVLDADGKTAILGELETLAGSGKRILGLAGKKTGPEAQVGTSPSELEFMGFLVFEDPVRESAKESFRLCRQAGIEIKILTGDHAGTTLSVMRSLGLGTGQERVYLGDQLETMDPAARRVAFLEGRVFARVNPEQKYELIRALKESGKIVAMTGDGINDAPALRLADIGISMGEHATDVARSSARMVLMKNDFAGLIEAVFEGRRIFSNLGTSFSFLIAFHVPVFVLSLVPVLLDAGRIFLPVHILLLEVLVHPVSSLTFENRPVTEVGVPTRGFFTGVGTALLKGSVLSAVCLGLYFYFLREGETLARSVSFLTILSGNLVWILLGTWPGWRLKIWITALAIVLFGVVLLGVREVSEACHFQVLGIPTVLAGFALGIGITGAAVAIRTLRRTPNHSESGSGSTRDTDLSGRSCP